MAGNRSGRHGCRSAPPVRRLRRRGASRGGRPPDRRGRRSARQGDQKRQPEVVGRLFEDLAAEIRDRVPDPVPPAVDRARIDQDLGGGRRGGRHGDDEDRHPGRMVGPFHEGQPRDDLGRLGSDEAAPPGAGPGAAVQPHEAEVGPGARHGLDHRGGTGAGHERHGIAEMEPRRVPHRSVAGGDVGVDAIGGLHVGEGRDDDAPDALDRVERQPAAVTLRDVAHHGGLAIGPERRASARPGLDGDQAVDDGAALDQALVHRGVDAIDLDPEVVQRLEPGRRGAVGWRSGHERLRGATMSRLVSGAARQRKGSRASGHARDACSRTGFRVTPRSDRSRQRARRWTRHSGVAVVSRCRELARKRHGPALSLPQTIV